MKKNISIALFVGIILTIFIEKFQLDVMFSSKFYNLHDGFFLKDLNIVLFLYKFGPLPALLLAIFSLFVFLTSFFKKELKKYKRQTLYLVLVMILGPGILVNAIFKDHWGRPRPRQIKEFGGKFSYKKVWEPSKLKYGRSFPSGHAAMGFYFMSLYFIFRKKNKKLSYLFFALGIGAGTIIGFARILQGAHFLLDVLWSGLFVYITCEALNPILEN